MKTALLLLIAAVLQAETRNIILITADGLRWQELFNGIDPLLMNEKTTGMEKASALRDRLWRASAEARRSALMPFFWTRLAPEGAVLGNPQRNSPVAVTNAFRVSYPGYSEILTGRAQDQAVRNNDKIQNPTPTVLEFLRRKLGLSQREVALFGSWELFHFIGESRPGSIFINAGYREADGSPRMRELSALQFKALTPWDSVRHDFVTLEMGLDYLERVRPRVLYLSLGESDDWAHDRRYDRVLSNIGYFDEALKRIREWVERTPDYRGRTSIIVTVDHGRGSTLEDWHGHGPKVAGAERIWAVFWGPDTPARGEVADSAPAFQRDIAPTIIDLMGIDYREYKGVAGRPIAAARRAGAARAR